MARQPPARDVAPVAMRVRVHYRKHGRLRFASHRDFQRALERAIRRAEVPIAFSAGFSPHPRISYTNAVPTGAASEAEYVELGLTRPVETAALARALDEALPAGFDVVEVVVARTPDFAARLEASRWQVRIPGTTTHELARAVEAVWAAPEALVERMTKSGLRKVRVSDAVIAMTAGAQTADGADSEDSQDPCAILHLVVRHVAPSVRPDDVLSALRDVAALQVPPGASITRLAQGPLGEDGVAIGDPLALDRQGVHDG